MIYRGKFLNGIMQSVLPRTVSLYAIHRQGTGHSSTVASRLQVRVEATVIIILGSYLPQARKLALCTRICLLRVFLMSETFSLPAECSIRLALVHSDR